MKKETSWRLIRLIAFLPFLAFAPLTLTSRNHPTLYFWGFFVYLTIWAIACAVADRKYFPENWKMKCVVRVIGVVGLQLVISFGITFWIFKGQFNIRGADGKLKIEQNQRFELTRYDAQFSCPKHKAASAHP